MKQTAYLLTIQNYLEYSLPTVYLLSTYGFTYNDPANI